MMKTYPLKRYKDIVIAIIFCAFLSPVLLLIALLVRINLGSPILFLHQRPGLHGNRFTLYKFRTMTNICAPSGQLLPDAERLTPFGRFLRSTSLDELPELFNVLKGEMSLVGPRPLLMEYLDRYTSEQMRRHDVMPGITGWAQVNGRNALSWEEKFELDVWYVDHMSMWLDIRILAFTLLKVIQRDGITERGKVTMTEFAGSPERHQS